MVYIGIATRYGLGRSDDLIPLGARFSAPVQTSTEAYPTSYTKRQGDGFNHATPSSAEDKRGVELYLYSTKR